MMVASTFTNYDFRGTHDYTGAANCYRYYSAGDAVNYDGGGGRRVYNWPHYAGYPNKHTIQAARNTTNQIADRVRCLQDQ